MDRLTKIVNFTWCWLVVNVWLIGVPVLFYGVGMSLFRTAFSAQCAWSGANCDHAWNAPQVAPTPPPIKVQIDGFESDGYTYGEPAKRK